jgi:hypothetical protein
MSARTTPTRRPLGLRLGVVVAMAALPVAQPAESAPSAAWPSPEARSVMVSPPLCKVGAFPLAPFLDYLRVELAGRGLACCTLADPDHTMPTVASVQVKVEIDPCTADADRLQVSAHAAAVPRTAERQVSLADVPETARPRALALAVAELIRSLEQGLPGKVPEAVVVAGQDSVASPASSLSEELRPIHMSIHVEAEARGVPTRDTTLWGGRVGLTAHRQIFHADLDLGGNTARTQVALGDVLLRSASVGFGFGPRLANRTAVLDLGLRAELGWAWIRGTTTLTDVRTGAGSMLISSVGIRAALEIPAHVKVLPRFALEAGAMVNGMKGEASGTSVAGMTGYYLLAALGIGVSL